MAVRDWRIAAARGLSRTDKLWSESAVCPRPAARHLQRHRQPGIEWPEHPHYRHLPKAVIWTGRGNALTASAGLFTLRFSAAEPCIHVVVARCERAVKFSISVCWCALPQKRVRPDSGGVASVLAGVPRCQARMCAVPSALVALDSGGSPKSSRAVKVQSIQLAFC